MFSDGMPNFEATMQRQMGNGRQVQHVNVSNSVDLSSNVTNCSFNSGYTSSSNLPTSFCVLMHCELVVYDQGFEFECILYK